MQLQSFQGRLARVHRAPDETRARTGVVVAVWCKDGGARAQLQKPDGASRHHLGLRPFLSATLLHRHCTIGKTASPAAQQRPTCRAAWREGPPGRPRPRCHPRPPDARRAAGRRGAASAASASSWPAGMGMRRVCCAGAARGHAHIARGQCILATHGHCTHTRTPRHAHTHARTPIEQVHAHSPAISRASPILADILAMHACPGPCRLPGRAAQPVRTQAACAQATQCHLAPLHALRSGVGGLPSCARTPHTQSRDRASPSSAVDDDADTWTTLLALLGPHPPAITQVSVYAWCMRGLWGATSVAVVVPRPIGPAMQAVPAPLCAWATHVR